MRVAKFFDKLLIVVLINYLVFVVLGSLLGFILQHYPPIEAVKSWEVFLIVGSVSMIPTIIILQLIKIQKGIDRNTKKLNKLLDYYVCESSAKWERL